MFAGGPGAALATATQTVDVSSSGAAIDAGQIRVTLAGLLGGWEGQEDSATVQATFLGASGGALGSVTIGPVTASDRSGKSASCRVGRRPVASGTRSIRVVITARRSSGVYNDGYSDNVSLTLAGSSGPKAPPPAWPALPDALVPLGSVSNGCGGGEASAQGKFGDTSTFRDSNVNPTAKSYRVNFREAAASSTTPATPAPRCATACTAAVVDFFTWTQKRVDDKFLADMSQICVRTIPASATIALANCKATGGNASFGAQSRYNFVHRAGFVFWQDRPNLRGLWALQGDAVATKWAIIQSGRTVKAVWHGGAGHPNLRGEFRGTLISRDQDSVVRGSVQITENGKTTMGPASMQYDPGTVRADRLILRGRVVGTLER